MYVSIEKTDNGYIVRINYDQMMNSETRVYNKLSDAIKYIKGVLEPEQQS
jgi:hypothetical protein